MLKHGFLVTAMLIMLLARPASLPPGNKEVFPSPATCRESSGPIAKEETPDLANQLPGLDKQEIMLPVDHYSAEESVPSKINLVNLNLSAPEGQLGFPGSAAPLPGPLDCPDSEPSVNFLLLGHRGSRAEILMVVSLIPGQTACLLAVCPGSLNQGGQNEPGDFSPVPVSRTSRAELINRLEEISGKKIDFIIGLNLEGVIEIVNLMGGIEFNSYAKPAGNHNIEGRQAVDLLTCEPTPAREKQRLLRALLLKASAMEFTKVGLTLLKIGYHNLNTDLSPADLIKLRKVTHSISPDQVIYRELP
ncbi:MAG TPA: hypothetical protein GX693_05120 [Firmicutes bacterium]|nr:hypothetical protein [Bacillota bacterium]